MYQEWNAEAKQRLLELRNNLRIKGQKPTKEEREELTALHNLEYQDDEKRFGKNIDVLSEILYKHDPIGLVPCEVPKDEYELEARMILREMDNKKEANIREITKIVYDVFDKMFNHSTTGRITDCTGPIDRACYEQIAVDFIAAIIK